MLSAAFVVVMLGVIYAECVNILIVIVVIVEFVIVMIGIICYRDFGSHFVVCCLRWLLYLLLLWWIPFCWVLCMLNAPFVTVMLGVIFLIYRCTEYCICYSNAGYHIAICCLCSVPHLLPLCSVSCCWLWFRLNDAFVTVMLSVVAPKRCKKASLVRNDPTYGRKILRF